MQTNQQFDVGFVPPACNLKRYSSTGVFLWIWQICEFKNETLA